VEAEGLDNNFQKRNLQDHITWSNVSAGVFVSRSDKKTDYVGWYLAISLHPSLSRACRGKQIGKPSFPDPRFMKSMFSV
jgi:hypothetical protein